MIGRLWAIALNTFREAIRNKVLYGIIAVVVMANLFALVLGQLSLHQEARVARDVGLFSVSLFGVLTAIVLGVSLLYGEIQKKTVHNVLSKPVERHEFVLGKYIGMAVTLTLLVALFTAATAAMLWLADVMDPYSNISFNVDMAKAVLLAYAEVLLIAAVAIFFSAFSTPFLSGIFTLGIFVLGRWSAEMRAAAAGSDEEWIQNVARVATLVLPDLSVLFVSGGQVDGEAVSVHGSFVTWGYVSTSLVYAATWIVGLLLLAMVSFRYRDFA